MATWQYRLHQVLAAGSALDDGLEKLNGLGEDGWEAVAVFPNPEYKNAYFVLLKTAARDARPASRAA